MDPSIFKNIKLMIGESKSEVRFGLRTALLAVGFEQIEDTDQVSAIRQTVNNEGIDLLVCDARLADGDCSALIRQIRHLEIGKNPFVNIITLVSVADEQAVKSAINSGTDDILALPVSAARLLDRIAHLTRERKPFVVTTDYIGPDRRSGHRPGTQKIPNIQVPNPLRALADPQPDREKLKSEIDAMVAVFNNQKIERYAYQIGFLVERVDRITMAVPDDQSVRSDLDRLAWVSDDINRRLTGSSFTHWADRCRSLANVIARVRAAEMKPTAADMSELRSLARVFRPNFEQPKQLARSA